jgi:HK97 family phage portal protein
MTVVQTQWGPKPTLTLAGGTPTTLASPSMPLGSIGRGLTVSGRPVSFARIYRTQPMIAASANVLIRQTARLPLKLYRYVDAEQEHRERVRDHAAAQLLARPRPRRRGAHLRAEIAMSVFVHGTWVGWKRRPRRGAPPTQLWTLDWRNLTAYGDGQVVEAWEWHGRGVPDVPRWIDPADVVVVGWNAPEGEVGVSPLEQLGVTVRSEDGLQRYSEANMRNAARPGMAAILDKAVSADKVVRDGLRDELLDVHGGIEKTGLPAILGGGIIDLKPLVTQTAVEAALIEQRKVNREEAAAVYGVPQPLAGILEHATLANVKELHRILYVTYLGAHLDYFAESVQAQLIDDEPAWDPDGIFCEFDLNAVLKGDPTDRFNAYAVALDHGVLTLNDVRRLENLPPYEDARANEPLIAANNVRPLSAVGTDGGISSASDQFASLVEGIVADRYGTRFADLEAALAAVTDPEAT